MVITVRRVETSSRSEQPQKDRRHREPRWERATERSLCLDKTETHYAEGRDSGVTSLSTNLVLPAFRIQKKQKTKQRQQRSRYSWIDKKRSWLKAGLQEKKKNTLEMLKETAWNKCKEPKELQKQANKKCTLVTVLSFIFSACFLLTVKHSWGTRSDRKQEEVYYGCDVIPDNTWHQTCLEKKQIKKE